MRTTAKICGLSEPVTLDAAIAGGASHVGFVSFAPSPRHLDPSRIAMLAARVPSHVTPIAVLVDPDDALVAAVLAAGVRTLQLHRTPPARLAAIRALGARELWAAVAVRRSEDLAAAGSLRGVADRVLYDAKTPEGAALPGGMGLRFDWGLLDGFRHPLPWALSGGLDAANVAEAIRRTRAPIVDVSSGVERAPGVKDADRIAEFLGVVARG